MKKISLFLVVVMVFGIFNISAWADFSSIEDKSSKVIFITSDNLEEQLISNIPNLLGDKTFMNEKKIGNDGIKQLGNKVKMNGIYNHEIINTIKLDVVDSIFINYNLINNENIISYAKQQAETGKGVYFYGENIDENLFCSLFDMEYNLKEDLASKGNVRSIPISSGVIEKSDLIYVGIVKEDWGYTFVTGESAAVDYYRTIDSLFREAIHAKKVKLERPYEDINRINTTTMESNNLTPIEVSNIDQFPIVNSKRVVKDFNTFWSVINSYYLHQVADGEADADYFLLELMTEFSTSTAYVLADQFNNYLQPTSSSDWVRDGGPKSQGGVTSVSVNIYPPSVGFTFDLGQKMDIVSTLTSSSFNALYKEADFWGTALISPSLFRTFLSFKSTGTFVSVQIQQKAKSSGYPNWYFSHNPYIYTYAY